MTPATPVRACLVAVAVASALPVGAQSIVVDVGRGRIGEYVVVSPQQRIARASATSTSIRTRAAWPDAPHRTEASAMGGRRPLRRAAAGWRGPASSSNSPGHGRSPSTTAEAKAVFDQTVASTNAQGVDFQKLSPIRRGPDDPTPVRGISP